MSERRDSGSGLDLESGPQKRGAEVKNQDIYGATLLLGFSSLACSGSASVDDGQCRCRAGSQIEFEPVLAGDDVEYAVTLDADFGAGTRNFEVPVECRARVGQTVESDPENRTGDSSCLGIDHPTSAGVAPGEVEPPYMMFTSSGTGDNERTATLDGVFWRGESTSASVTIRRGESEVFKGVVEFEDATCQARYGEVSYRRAVVRLP